MTYEVERDPREDEAEQEPEPQWLAPEEIEAIAALSLVRCRLDGLDVPPPLRAVARGNNLNLVPRAPEGTCGAYAESLNLYYDPGGAEQDINRRITHELGHHASCRSLGNRVLFEEDHHSIGLAIAMPPEQVRRLLGSAWSPDLLLEKYHHLPAFDVLLRGTQVQGGAAFIFANGKFTRIVGQASKAWLLPILRTQERALLQLVMEHRQPFALLGGVEAHGIVDHRGERGIVMYVDERTLGW